MYALLVRAVGLSICTLSTLGIAGLTEDQPETAAVKSVVTEEPPITLATGMAHIPGADSAEPISPEPFSENELQNSRPTKAARKLTAASNKTTGAVRSTQKEAPGGENPGILKRTYRVTAYCDRGITAAGVPSGVGQCAAPANIPFGSKIYIPALKRTFVVTDRTHRRFRHNTVDIFIPQKDRCWEFGRRYLTCHVTLPATRGS